MEKNRIDYIDIAKAIGILLMILGHCSVIPYMPYRHFIFTFHMPLFFILSGYFYKKKNIKISLKRDAKHLLIPYFATCGAIIILTLVVCIIKGQYKPMLSIIAASLIGSGSPHSCLYLSQLPSIGAIWFFPALFVCKNVYNSLAVYDIKKRLIYSITIYVIATIIGRYIIFIPFSILCGLSAIIFYAIGDYIKTIKPKITMCYWIIGVICWCISFQFSHIYLVQPRTDLYFIDVLGATTATLLTCKISSIIDFYLNCSGILTWIGKNSMYILCFHLIDLHFGVSNKLMHNNHHIFIIVSMLIIPIIATFLYVNIKKKCHFF